MPRCCQGLIDSRILPAPQLGWVSRQSVGFRRLGWLQRLKHPEYEGFDRSRSSQLSIALSQSSRLQEWPVLFVGTDSRLFQVLSKRFQLIPFAYDPARSQLRLKERGPPLP